MLVSYQFSRQYSLPNEIQSKFQISEGSPRQNYLPKIAKNYLTKLFFKYSLNFRTDNGVTSSHPHTHTLLSSASNDCRHFCTTWLPLGSLMSCKKPGRSASMTRLISSLFLRLSISFCTARVLKTPSPDSSEITDQQDSINSKDVQIISRAFYPWTFRDMLTST